jgi:drug/metabolite transporter (DMT)-like permease
MLRRVAPEALLSVAGLTAVAMLAFAANSLLCRLALQQGRIDPASFGAVRLLAGALVLAFVMRARRQPVLGGGDWRASALLFAYVALFSFAYVSLPAGTGALILFGAVQLTMLGAGLLAGERFAPMGWLGLALASAGAAIRCADAALEATAIRWPPLPPASSARRRWACCWRSCS